MSLELATQVGALVGTSFLLFIMTQPKKHGVDDDDDELRFLRKGSSSSGGREGSNDVPCQDLHRTESAERKLKGLRRYSSYHRKRFMYRHQGSSSGGSSSGGSSSGGGVERRQRTRHRPSSSQVYDGSSSSASTCCSSNSVS